MRALATREKTVVIALNEVLSPPIPEEASLLNDRLCSLSPSPLLSEPTDQGQNGEGSGLYSADNSSSDTIPETSSVTDKSAFPNITLIKPGAHRIGDTDQLPTVKLEDTIQDLDLNSDFNIEYTHTPKQPRPHTAHETPSKRHLSSRGAKGKRRALTECHLLSSPCRNHTELEKRGESESMSSQSDTQSSVFRIHNTTSLHEPVSVDAEPQESDLPTILPFSPLSASYQLSNSTDESISQVEVTEFPLRIKRSIRSSTDSDGPLYTKRLKVSPIRRPATSLDTVVINTLPFNLDEEPAAVPLHFDTSEDENIDKNQLESRIMSSPPWPFHETEVNAMETSTIGLHDQWQPSRANALNPYKHTFELDPSLPERAPDIDTSMSAESESHNDKTVDLSMKPIAAIMSKGIIESSEHSIEPNEIEIKILPPHFSELVPILKNNPFDSKQNMPRKGSLPGCNPTLDNKVDIHGFISTAEKIAISQELSDNSQDTEKITSQEPPRVQTQIDSTIVSNQESAEVECHLKSLTEETQEIFSIQMGPLPEPASVPAEPELRTVNVQGVEYSAVAISVNSPLQLDTKRVAKNSSKMRRGPVLRVGLSKLARVEPLHSYLRKRGP